MERPVFREDFAAPRCVIPSTGFYEWSHDKNNDYMKEIHSRMPLIMPSSFIRGYIADTARAASLLSEPTTGLMRIPAVG